ncbi:fatty acyl-AMP ligase [Streptomyces kaniharaensis]|uniref:Fatty acyl-AMP ligase n=1 Tax=Streptomyces kaniharaensis TaxID=212423 RepID=A0A6N7KTQ7_9ACTN|nr:fatty acyl-AMP ligase [Streptomyces kaniharaensis]MQS14900.1 fatty acyl-AMP ligase [Streptomyces kaniharaensis]
MAGFRTFTELMLDRAEQQPEADAHIELSHSPAGVAERRLTYGELDRTARRIASLIRRHGGEGSPVLLLYPSTADFLAAYVGCLYAGAIGVPAPMPSTGGRAARAVDRVTGVLQDSAARLVLTGSASAPDVSLWLATARAEGVTCVVTDDPDRGDADDWRRPRTGADDLAFLQYTSGSVSRPRGVMVSHRNLIANHEALQATLRTTGEDRFGGWLPHFHDMGFIAHLLHPLWLGSASVQMSPVAFVKHPLRWLRAIDDHGVTVGGGPNFCYDLCLNRIRDEEVAGLDLSRWRLVLNGAEPVRRDTLEAFAARFAPAGLRATAMYPSYGLAEATLLVSAGTPGEPYGRTPVNPRELERNVFEPVAERAPDARTLVACGRPAGYDLRIVEPSTGAELPEGTVGEVWLRGPSVAQGYWRRPKESEETFRAALRGGESGYLRTGDLGVLRDGELYVTGRLKEVLILNGRNLYPYDIEAAVRSTAPQLSAATGAAFSVDAGREQLVLVQEVRSAGQSEETLRELSRRIIEKVGREFNVPVANLLLVRPGTVRRTTSGKVQRTLMRSLFLAGEVRGDYEVLDGAVRAVVRARDRALGEDLLHPQPVGGGVQPW